LFNIVGHVVSIRRVFVWEAATVPLGQPTSPWLTGMDGEMTPRRPLARKHGNASVLCSPPDHTSADSDMAIQAARALCLSLPGLQGSSHPTPLIQHVVLASYPTTITTADFFNYSRFLCTYHTSTAWQWPRRLKRYRPKKRNHRVQLGYRVGAWGLINKNENKNADMTWIMHYFQRELLPGAAGLPAQSHFLLSSRVLTLTHS
jgi:hypothetical protein